MRHALPLVALVAALMTLGGCDGGECTDLDEDGFGVGDGCEAADCDDSTALHHADCSSCSDPDGDGFGVGCDLGFDCDPTNGRHWADCGKCMDGDLDGAGPDCDLGVDCDDTDPDQFSGTCGGCTDADGDGVFTGCDRYVTRPGPDCDDADGDNYLRCGYCADSDGDGRFVGCDRYVDHQGPDCNDFDNNNWSSCGICRDADADGYSVGCDAYTGALEGPDCNDGSGLHWSDCGQCSDSDGDGRGTGCNLGADCSDSNRDAWGTCGTCADNDTDGRWAACDQYSLHQGPDCDDTDPNAYSKCATCLDTDSDGYWTGCDLYTVAKPGQDCNDTNNNVWASCGTCRDLDTDTYFVGCDAYTSIAGPDCGDTDANNWGQCSTCLDTDGDGRYAACDAYTTIAGPDCAPGDNEHWSDCGACVDTDGDGRGAACDLGMDCNESSDQHWADCATCTDIDGDGYGIGTCDLGSTGDCDDSNPARNPGAADTTVNGVDENCNGIDGPGFVDNFDDSAFAPEWASAVGDTMIQSVYKVSGLYALNVGGGIGEVQSTFFDTTACTSGVAYRFSVKRGPEAPDSSENLSFEYWNGSVWTVADTTFGASVDDASFSVHQNVIVAVAAQYLQFRVRFRTTGGSGTGLDDYFIDDLAVGCAIDTDGDQTIDPFDCAPADPKHWSDCGVCVDGDGDGYGTSCNLGADCPSDNDPAQNPGAADLTVDGTDQNCNGFDGIQTATPSNVTGATIIDGGGEAAACGAFNAAVSSIVVSGVGRLTDVDVAVNATHPLDSDLDVWLQYTPATGSPVCIQLSTDNGAGANYTSTVFSDEGATSITAGTSPFTGTFQPESPLSALDGKLRAGTYTLYVNDDTASNAGSLTSWAMTLMYY
jgi:subtilisin-like proprotein convertase family protein